MVANSGKPNIEDYKQHPLRVIRVGFGLSGLVRLRVLRYVVSAETGQRADRG
jgi:hypothetical protein